MTKKPQPPKNIRDSDLWRNATPQECMRILHHEEMHRLFSYLAKKEKK